MHVPIVMTAFGTTTKAMNTYSFIHEICKNRFPDHKILWSYSSRMVKDRSKKKQDMKHPHQVLSELKEQGHEWAVVQSLHLVSGHEFYRLVQEAQESNIRTSLGLPLLSSPEDYQAVADTLISHFSLPASHSPDEALILVGHGSDHPSWSSYPAFQQIFRKKMGPRVYVGVVEDGHPPREEIVESVKRSGYTRVRLMPFMLIAGIHFKEDLMGDEDSWRIAFESEGISVSAEAEGLGCHPGIVDIYCQHIQDALDVIPTKEQSK